MPDLETRSRMSLGISSPAIYEMVARALSARGVRGGAFLDIGCGCGQLWQYLGRHFDEYIGVDAVRYEDLPQGIDFHRHDLHCDRMPLPCGIGDVVAAVETIEHLENPRAFFRELLRLTKRGGWLLVTTPNQLSLLSLLTLAFKHQFNAFQEVHYPAHLTALLEVDLRRMAAECGLQEVAVEYSRQGRIVFTGRHYPQLLVKSFPRSCSDNLLLIGKRLAEPAEMIGPWQT
ncbi:MAG TPA: class I SAM-dependent methyltransferase [Candidatus Saccharimonadales bacterium]|jgi:SAM-dependent methyltransferase|nr:class I SAM-dependent methyltransferase [Candidatus Saccharimonadales bacterium]